MKRLDNMPERLAFLIRVVEREMRHLLITDQRLFARPLTVDKIGALEQDVTLAEQMDAYVSRFGRVQDTVGDKLLPELLIAMGERAGPVIDNLDKSERFGWLRSADNWLAMRQLRNKMVHEYIEDPVLLTDALNTGHQFVHRMQETVEKMTQEARKRFGQ